MQTRNNTLPHTNTHKHTHLEEPGVQNKDVLQHV